MGPPPLILHFPSVCLTWRRVQRSRPHFPNSCCNKFIQLNNVLEPLPPLTRRLRMSSLFSRFDGVESFIAPLPPAVEAIRRQSKEFQSRLKKVEQGVLATSSPKTDSQVKAMLDELHAALAKCQHDFSISFEECHARFELQVQEKQTRVEALIVGLKTQFVTSICDMHANLTREYNQSVSKVREQLNSCCEALTKHNENLERTSSPKE